MEPYSLHKAVALWKLVYQLGQIYLTGRVQPDLELILIHKVLCFYRLGNKFMCFVVINCFFRMIQLINRNLKHKKHGKTEN